MSAHTPGPWRDAGRWGRVGHEIQGGDGDGRHRHMNGDYADNRVCSQCGGTGAWLGLGVTWQMVMAALKKARGQ